MESVSDETYMVQNPYGTKRLLFLGLNLSWNGEFRATKQSANESLRDFSHRKQVTGGYLYMSNASPVFALAWLPITSS